MQYCVDPAAASESASVQSMTNCETPEFGLHFEGINNNKSRNGNNSQLVIMIPVHVVLCRSSSNK